MPQILVVIIGIILVGCIRAFTVFIHEMGHAIPALLFSSKKVQVFLGSYGSREGTATINIGRLEIVMKKNFLFWNYGMCLHDPTGISIGKYAFIVLSGPLFSALVTCAAGLFILQLPSREDAVFFIGAGFFASGALDILINLSPRKEAIRFANGSFTFSDGRKLKNLLIYWYRSGKNASVIGYLYDEHYMRLVPELTRETGGRESKKIHSKAARSALNNDPQKNTGIQEGAGKRRELNAYDYFSQAIAFSKENDYTNAEERVSKALELDPGNAILLNSRGYYRLFLKKYTEALMDLTYAIRSRPQMAFAYNNRGYAKIQLKLYDEALQDIRHSLKLNDKNAYAWRNLGIYYFEMRQYEKALENFVVAFNIEKNIPELSDYIHITQDILGKWEN